MSVSSTQPVFSWQNLQPHHSHIKQVAFILGGILVLSGLIYWQSSRVQVPIAVQQLPDTATQQKVEMIALLKQNNLQITAVEKSKVINTLSKNNVGVTDSQKVEMINKLK